MKCLHILPRLKYIIALTFVLTAFSYPVYSYMIKGSEVQLDTSGFDGNIYPSDNTVQKAIQTINDKIFTSVESDPIWSTEKSSYVPTSRTINGQALTSNITIDGMVYPGAGIPVSTGSIWGTSITDNSANWNTAYGWGDHASEGYLTDAPSDSKQYARKDASWSEVVIPDVDLTAYAKLDASNQPFTGDIVVQGKVTGELAKVGSEPTHQVGNLWLDPNANPPVTDDHASLNNLDYANAGHTGFQPAGSYLTDAPSDGTTYGRKDGAWASASGVTDHSALSNLDYASAGHTGFEPTIPAGTYLTPTGDGSGLTNMNVIAGFGAYLSYYPTQSDTFVKATTTLTGGAFNPYLTTDPSKSLTGGLTGNSWISNSVNTNQRFHIDLGIAKVVTRVYYENGHTLGNETDRGAKDFTLWGTNDATAFATLTYATDTDWTQLTTNISTLDQHVASDVADPKYVIVTNSTAYRYYAFKFADNWGDATYINVRRIELQTFGTYSYGKIGIGTTTPSTELEVVGTIKATTLSGAIIGAWSSISVGVVYQAETDLWVCAYGLVAGGYSGVRIYTDASNPPTTARVGITQNADRNTAGVGCIVRKGEYYKITAVGTPSSGAYFKIPIGN